MPIVSGLISDVTNATRITGAWVRATALRASASGGLTTEENSPVDLTVEGTAARISMSVEPGPAVLMLTMGGEITETVPLLVPDVDCSLADAWQAARLATGHTQSALEAMASRAAEAVVEAENAAVEAVNAASEAQWYAENVADDSITSEKIVDAAVTSEKLAPDAVAGGNIVDAAVTSAKIEDGAVITSKLGNNAVTASKLAPDAVIPRNILNGSVTAGKIEDGAVTGPKIAPAYAQQASTRTVTLSKDTYSADITAHKVGRVVHLAMPNFSPGTWAATLTTSSATPLRPALMGGQFAATQPGISGSSVGIVVSGTQFSVQFSGNSGNIHLSYLSDNPNPLI